MRFNSNDAGRNRRLRPQSDSLNHGLLVLPKAVPASYPDYFLNHCTFLSIGKFFMVLKHSIYSRYAWQIDNLHSLCHPINKSPHHSELKAFVPPLDRIQLWYSLCWARLVRWIKCFLGQNFLHIPISSLSSSVFTYTVTLSWLWVYDWITK